MYGLHRSSLYEAVQKGRVTATQNAHGHKVIELSEMIRVFGEPPGKPDTSPTPTRQASPTPDNDPDTYRELIEELRALRQEVRELREQMLRLPAPDSTSKAPVADTKSEPVPTRSGDDPHGFRATLARIKAGG